MFTISCERVDSDNLDDDSNDVVPESFEDEDDDDDNGDVNFDNFLTKSGKLTRCPSIRRPGDLSQGL